LESDPVRLDWWDAERRAEDLVDRACLGHPFAHPRVLAARLAVPSHADALARCCLGAVTIARSQGPAIAYAPARCPRAEGTAISHELAEIFAPADGSHGDVWRLHLAVVAPRSELQQVARLHPLSLRVLAHFQPHVDLGFLRLRLWCVRRMGLLHPLLPGIR
jgi:hypothetical protein